MRDTIERASGKDVAQFGSVNISDEMTDGQQGLEKRQSLTTAHRMICLFVGFLAAAVILSGTSHLGRSDDNRSGNNRPSHTSPSNLWDVYGDDELIPLNTPAGEAMLYDAGTVRGAYVGLSMHFITQQTTSFCGVATLVTILNALNVSRGKMPAPSTWDPYLYLTQDNLFTECVEQNIGGGSPSEPGEAAIDVNNRGMTMPQLTRLLRCFVAEEAISPTRGGNSSAGGAVDAAADTALRQVLAEALGPGGRSFVAANFARASLGQAGWGHWSPVAAYSPVADRVLVLDVARYKYAPWWVSVPQLRGAMNTRDSTSGLSRGYVLIG